MLYLLHRLHEPDSWRLVFNLFRYVTFRSAAAAATAFIVTVVFLPALIRRLKRLKVLENTGHPHSEWLSERRRHKNGTPTMGGLAILAGLVGATALWADPANSYVHCALLGALALGAVGFVDDWMKLRGIGERGMPGRVKFALQVTVAVVIGLVLVYWGQGGPFGSTAGPAAGLHWAEGGPLSATRLAVPFLKPAVFAPELGILYVGVVVLVVVGCSNAANLTDGVDGLAAGCTGVATLTYAALAYLAGHATFAAYLNIPYVPGAQELVVVCAALGGSLLAFLWYNAQPAQVFMGDTGALAIGGLIGIVACMAKQELLLVLVGGVFVVEAGSVILQVSWFKLTGRRLFLMAPLHHHFQKLGWPDEKIVTRFWIMSLIFALSSVATLKVR